MSARKQSGQRALGLTMVATLGLALLSGCDGETQELQAWMDQQRREARPQVQPLAAPKKFDQIGRAHV